VSNAETAPITLRRARREDETALARIHAEVAQYYGSRTPGYFEIGELGDAVEATDENSLRLVAEADGQVVGALVARLIGPSEIDQRELASDSQEPRLRIEYLATAAPKRRQGVGTQLVHAAEEWGRRAGAEIAETTAFHGSALSLPFWEERMGYEERSVNLRKRLQ
jgi:ribosomal protein S18 acetylase RimI-like enzyme